MLPSPSPVPDVMIVDSIMRETARHGGRRRTRRRYLCRTKCAASAAFPSPGPARLTSFRPTARRVRISEEACIKGEDG